MGTGRRCNLFTRGIVGAIAVGLGLSLIGAEAHAGNTPTSSRTYYDVRDQTTGIGDNIIRLVDPVGCGNGGVSNPACGNESDLCAMIYVFDDDQEMGACCGCPITPNDLVTLSVERSLLNNWALASGTPGSGVVVIQSASQPNNPNCDAFSAQPVRGCNDGCDPSTGYTAAATIFGSLSRPQDIRGNISLTELTFFDDGGGDQVNNTYLKTQCAALLGNSSGSGICSCNIGPEPPA